MFDFKKYCTRFFIKNQGETQCALIQDFRDINQILIFVRKCYFGKYF